MVVSDVVEGTVVEETSVMPAPQAAAPATLFRTEDPVEALRRAKATAEALAGVVREAGMVKTISGKDYLLVEAWQTLGAQVGVTPVIVATRQLSDPAGWEARCEARTFDGRVLGAADSMCLKAEEHWKDSEEFEIRSMAQTRAMSRALASVLRFIPTLAGFSGTPAEEMSAVESRGAGKSSSKPSPKQLSFLERLVSERGVGGTELGTVMAYASENLSGGKGGSCSKLIDRIKANDAEKLAGLREAAAGWAASQSDVPADTTGLSDESDEGFDDLPFSVEGD